MEASVGAGTPLEPQKHVDTMKGEAKAGGSVKMELQLGSAFGVHQVGWSQCRCTL
jgi:hypothetical protein